MTGKETEFDNTKGPTKFSRLTNQKALARPRPITRRAYSARQPKAHLNPRKRTMPYRSGSLARSATPCKIPRRSRSQGGVFPKRGRACTESLTARQSARPPQDGERTPPARRRLPEDMERPARDIALRVLRRDMRAARRAAIRHRDRSVGRPRGAVRAVGKVPAQFGVRKRGKARKGASPCGPSRR